MISSEVVEIRGPWLKNKGDVLNLWSVTQRTDASTTLAVSSKMGLEKLPKNPRLHRVRWKPDRSALTSSFQSKSIISITRRMLDTLLTSLPDSTQRLFRTVDGRNVSVLLDCSGYAYGDVWDDERIQKRAEYYAQLQAQNSVVILLPQALGPFDNPSIRNNSTKLFQSCDLVFARDKVSYSHLNDLTNNSEKNGIAPDITHLVKGIAPQDLTRWRSKVCIVPNARMLDMTGKDVSENNYRKFLLLTIKLIQSSDLEPCLLIHEQNDMPLAKELQAKSNISIELIDEDALISKGILGSVYAVVGSRYHSLISSLSQGTPVIGTSWSHKYDELFTDYECKDYLFPLNRSNEYYESKITDFLSQNTNEDLRHSLQKRADIQKEKVENMWDRIETYISGKV